MTGCWIEAARRRIVRDGVVARASIVETRGSTPREAGAAMFVGRDDIEGSIGGGAFEFEVMRQARALIGAGARPWAREVARMTLGPDLGQCCGGSRASLSSGSALARTMCWRVFAGRGTSAIR